MTVPGLLTTKEVHEVKMSNTWCENETELRRLATHMIREATALTVTIKMPACYVLRPLHRTHVRLRSIGIDHDIYLMEVRHNWSGGPSGTVTTDLSGKLYVVT